MPGRLTTSELQPRDREILETLTRFVRVLTVTQIARAWWGQVKQPTVQARRRMRQLQQDGWVELLGLMAHTELPLPRPLATWQPGLPSPDHRKLARRLHTRWTEPEASTPCVIATEQTAALFAGTGGRPPRDSEATHDIHLAAVYLQMRRELPTRARSWVPEADLPAGQGIKVPDALVRDGMYRTAIEFGGQYDHAKLRSFHGYCNHKGWGYEIW